MQEIADVLTSAHTAKVYECVSANVFPYIDNAKWKAQIESKMT